MSGEDENSTYYVELPRKSSCSTSIPPSHTIKHQYVYAPCTKCRKSHYQQYTVVSGFVLKFVDQMCSTRSKNSGDHMESEESQLFLKCIDLASERSSEAEFCPLKKHSTIVQYSLKCESPENLKKSASDDHFPVRRNGLNPSDFNFFFSKSTQCCTTCLKLQRDCPVCSGENILESMSQTSQLESEVNYCDASVSSTKDEETQVRPSMIFKEINNCQSKQFRCDEACLANPSNCDIACDPIPECEQNPYFPCDKDCYSYFGSPISSLFRQNNRSADQSECVRNAGYCKCRPNCTCNENMRELFPENVTCIICGMSLF